MDEWIATPLGRYLIEREQDYFDQMVADIFGFNALQIGFTHSDLLRANRMPKRFAVAAQFSEKGRAEIKLLAEPGYLPIASQSIDLSRRSHAKKAKQPAISATAAPTNAAIETIRVPSSSAGGGTRRPLASHPIIRN